MSTVSPARAEDVPSLKDVGWLQVARSTVWFGVLVALAFFGDEMQDLAPGPRAVQALVISVVLATLSGALRLLFSVVIRRRLAAVRGADALDTSTTSYMIVFTLTMSGALTLWVVLDVTRTLVALPLLFVAGVFVIERIFAALLRTTDAPLDDPVLERRLRRFAREAGLGDVQVMRTRSTSRSIEHADPFVFIVRQTIEVPLEFLDEPSDVLETRLAAAIVHMRRPGFLTLSLKRILQLVVAALIIVAFDEQLVRLAGVGDVAAPGFIPMAMALLLFARGVSLPVSAAISRRWTTREIGDVLDLTRDPDAMLAAFAIDAGGVDQVNPIRRLISQRPSVRAATAEIERWRRSRRVTLLFTDVANSTELLHELGDDRWYHVVSDHDHVVRSVIEEFGGEEIDSAGDGFFVVFEDGGRAVLAAVELQRRLREIDVVPGTPLGVRMGLHVGETIRRGREVVGREVNLAARISAHAAPGEVLVSQELRDELAESARFTFGRPRSGSFKGFTDDHLVYPVEWWTDDRPEAVSRA